MTGSAEEVFRNDDEVFYWADEALYWTQAPPLAFPGYQLSAFDALPKSYHPESLLQTLLADRPVNPFLHGLLVMTIHGPANNLMNVEQKCSYPISARKYFQITVRKY